MPDFSALNEKGFIDELIVTETLDIEIGKLTLENIYSEKTALSVTILTVVNLVDGKKVKICIPMGSPAGDFIFDGDLVFQLRDLWTQWAKDHPEPDNGDEKTSE